MGGNNIYRKIKLTDFAPKEWFPTVEGSSVWISCYRALRIPEETSHPFTINLSGVIAVILKGQIQYLDTTSIYLELTPEEELKVRMPNVQQRFTADGFHMLLLTPFEVSGQRREEALVKQQLQETVGLLTAMNGRNMAFGPVFDNVFSMSGDKILANSSAMESPLWFPKPDISETGLSKISQVARAIDCLPQDQGNRIKLSLRWFESGMRGKGIDSFLSYWIALETIGMNDSNIRPLNKLLASIYKMSVQEANIYFGIGRICNLRGLIVHQGRIIAIHANLQKYIEALYADILLAKLDLPTEHRAKAVLVSPDFKLNEYIKI